MEQYRIYDGCFPMRDGSNPMRDGPYPPSYHEQAFPQLPWWAQPIAMPLRRFPY
jgi:hypothetical protein